MLQVQSVLIKHRSLCSSIEGLRWYAAKCIKIQPLKFDNIGESVRQALDIARQMRVGFWVAKYFFKFRRVTVNCGIAEVSRSLCALGDVFSMHLQVEVFKVTQ